MLGLLLDVASPLSLIFGLDTDVFVLFIIAFISIAFLVAMIIIVAKTRKKADKYHENNDNDQLDKEENVSDK